MSKLSEWRKDRTLAHVAPFGVFMSWMLVSMIVSMTIEWKHPEAGWWRRYPEQWIYPLQTLTTGATLAFFWKHYELKWSKWIVVGVIAGVVGIGVWLLPTTLYDRWNLQSDPESGWMKWLGIAERKEGFNPGVFENPAAYWASLIFRFLRAVVVVALVEEIFWRGFLMRWLLKPDGNYWKVPFGKAAWKSFLIVTGLFIIVHGSVDYFGAIVYGSLTYLLAVKSKSLSACVAMHAVANLLMGLYAMAYGKFGLW